MLVLRPDRARPALTRAERQPDRLLPAERRGRDGGDRAWRTTCASLAQAIVLNYLALHDRTGDFATVLPMNGLGSGAALDALVAFQPIV